MKWETIVAVGVPAASGLVWMIYKLGTIDSKLEFLQKAFDVMLVRMDRFETRMDRFESRMDRFEKYLRKSTKRHK